MEIAAWQPLWLQSALLIVGHFIRSWAHSERSEARLHSLHQTGHYLAQFVLRGQEELFLRTQRSSLPDINGLNDTLTDARNLDGWAETFAPAVGMDA